MEHRIDEDVLRAAAPTMPDSKVNNLLQAQNMEWESYKGFSEQAIFNQRMAQIMHRVFPAMGERAEAAISRVAPFIENAALYFKYEVLDGGSLGGTIAKGSNVFDVRLIGTSSVLDGDVETNRTTSCTAGTGANLLPNDAGWYEMGNGTTKKQEMMIIGAYDPLASTPVVEEWQILVDDESVTRKPIMCYEEQLTDYPFVLAPFTWVLHDSKVNIDIHPVLSEDTMFFPIGVEFLTADQISDVV